MIFLKAFKPEEQSTGETHNRIIQVKMIKPVPGVGNYTPRVGEILFPPTKGYAMGRDGLPSQELPQEPGVVNGEATNHCANPGLL